MQQKFVIPSREDAVDLTRKEKKDLLYLTNLAGSLCDTMDDFHDRLEMVENGNERMKEIADKAVQLLTDIRTTIPVRQRNSLNNTAHDYQFRLVPKFTPSSNSIVLAKEDFRALVDAAQCQCRECVEDSEGAKRCKLYQILTSTVPLEKYPEMGLCPYNLSEWEN